MSHGLDDLMHSERLLRPPSLKKMEIVIFKSAFSIFSQLGVFKTIQSALDHPVGVT